jgi:uncharacterized protein YidB (DUF937 family)
MAKGMPSLVALLGLLAVAGYQNRDKLGSALGGLNTSNANPNNQLGANNGGLGGMLGGMLGGAGAGGLGSVLTGGLGELMERFNGAGNGHKVESWVQPGDNQPIEASELEQTLGADTIATLQEQTGLSKQELLERLSKTLPDAVNRFTPDGRLPTETEASRFV